MSRTGLLRFNPEFQRCLWLELTPTRLVLMPSVLLVLFGGGKLIGGDDLAQWALYALYFLLVLWGSRLAAESFAEEAAQGTWDLQRLSAVDPFSMALGKLFGGCAFAWYGAMLCLAALPFLPGEVGAQAVIGALVGGVSAQAAALMTVMLLHRFDGASRRGAVTMAQIMGILAFVPTLMGASSLQSVLTPVGEEAWWYGAAFNLQSFTLVHEITWAVWLIVGVIWLTRVELGHAVSPAPWMLFVLWQIIDGIGVLFRGDFAPPSAVVFGISAMIAAGWSYAAVLASPFGVADLKRWLTAKDWKRRLQTAPAWSLSAALAVLLGAAVLPFSGSDMILGGTLIALFLRDLALIGAIRLAARRRTAMLLCVTAFLLYGLGPQILEAVGASSAWLLPQRGAYAASVFGAAISAAAALAFLYLSWKRRSAR